MNFKKRTINRIADMICGNNDKGTGHFVYRSSSYLTGFFEDCDTDYVHDGSTRKWWVAGVLEEVLSGSQPNQYTPPELFATVIRNLMDQEDALDEGPERPAALAELNATLAREGLEAFYGKDRQCYLRHIESGVVTKSTSVPQRALSKEELARRELLASFLDQASEDELTEEVLLPLFRQLGFQRITVAGHKDKALEYGKDVWMKFRLPTAHGLYFGIQVKRGKLDAAGKSKHENITEVLNQVRMMLGHMVFDPEINKRRLVDHAMIIAGGEITKQARNWLGEHLDASHRSQILFMDRDELLDLFVANNVPMPKSLEPPTSSLDNEIPF